MDRGSTRGRLFWISRIVVAVGLGVAVSHAKVIPADIRQVQPGPVTVHADERSIVVQWKDETGQTWSATFSLDTSKPLISVVLAGGKEILTGAQPFYRCESGRRRGGWDAFFDFPPGAPEGTRAFLAEFHPQSARVRSLGDRIEVSFDGLRMGIFEGSLRYIFYPDSRLIEQQAAVATREPDVAYIYDAGLRIGAKQEATASLNMNSEVGWFDTSGHLQTITPGYASERRPAAVRYRSIAARSGAGSVAVFAAPHQYFFARDYTTNMGYVWYKAWRGAVSLGIRQLPDDDSPFYPWMNAPPGTVQEMRIFLTVSTGAVRQNLDEVRRYTHGDRFPKLPGYVTFAPHWHFAQTMQAREHGFDWQPPFKPAMQAIGLDAAMIMDFHGDGHPTETTEVRPEELTDYFRACRSQSDRSFLLIPAEEPNAYLGGHWALVFPHPVFWYMSRKARQPLTTTDPKYGRVYHTGSAQDVWEMIEREHGYVYQTHPRTKGSTGYPDKIRDTTYFQDARYLGLGWKAMPSDLSLPRLGERAFRTIDDMNNLGLRKRMIGEVDVFQIDPTDELYAHMNVNYVRLASLPTYENYGQLLERIAQGDYFITTGEILMPDAELSGSGDRIRTSATIDYTFPLRLAEIVWGDGREVHRQTIPLEQTREFGHSHFEWDTETKGWQWARLAVWDVAGNGAFTNPIWRTGGVAK